MKRKLWILIFVGLLVSGACSLHNVTQAPKSGIRQTGNNTIKSKPLTQSHKNNSSDIEAIIKKANEKYQGTLPKQWGERVSGVVKKLDTREMVVALTFDACGGSKKSNGYDAGLIDFLTEEKIPATLFINSRWIDANPGTFKKLSENTLFDIENHGTGHMPLSITGNTAYKIKGTQNIAEVVEEVERNAEKISKLTGRKPHFFRSGTAYYDEIAVAIVNDLGYEAVNFDILGDAGATFTKDQVTNACLRAKPGSILIFHMNHPEGYTFEGIRDVIKELRARGYRFVKLGDYKYVRY
jgi:peptidoglycan/xylan/chitin deacetylase (PgdA/CDA1 family)